jgi:ATP-dependent Clp protease ATP-binding subunit ClpX
MRRLMKLVGMARSRRRLRCSFCGRDASQVERLVAGPSVYICDSCIKTCVEVLDQHGGLPALATHPAR